MGLGFKLFSILGNQTKKKKMKEKKSESFSSIFRRGGTRYSFVSDKKKTSSPTSKDESDGVQIQRVSWSSFPIVKLNVPEEEDCPGEGNLPSRLSRSSENLKKQGKSRTLNSLCKSKSSSFFKSSSYTMRHLLSVGSTSTVSSSSNSSASSSPKVRQSWSSNVMNVLERYGTEPATGSSSPNESECPSRHEDFPIIIRSNEVESQRGSRAPVGISPPYGNSSSDKGRVNQTNLLNFARSGFPSSSLMEESEEDDVMCTPKIICAHKKTPDVTRKTPRQIFQELEDIKHLRTLPEEAEPGALRTTTIHSADYKENLSPNYENFPFVNGGGKFDLNSLKGYRTSTPTPVVRHLVQRTTSAPATTSADRIPSHRILLSSKQDGFVDRETPKNRSTASIATSSSRFIGSRSFVECEDTRGHRHPEANVEEEEEEEDSSSNQLDSSSLTSNNILIEDSEGEDSETMPNNYDEESSTFEKRLEDDLENLNESRRNSKGNVIDTHNTLSDEEDVEEKVQLRRKLKPNLHINIEKAKAFRTLSNDRVFKRVTEGGSDSEKSSRSSPKTPRSPVIDIDDLFYQRHKKLEENPKDNLTHVKDLTQRLRLSTNSSTPPTATRIEWINGIKDNAEMKHVMSPVVLEYPEGVFRLKESLEEEETSRQPTDEQRETNLSKALHWIKDELIKMREQDQSLARQLIHLQIEMQRLRLLRSCTQHEALLEEVTCEEEEQRALMTTTDLIDLPNNQRECAYFSLRDFGVTKMNIANRRFTLR